jgi:hypothetical protein
VIGGESSGVTFGAAGERRLCVHSPLRAAPFTVPGGGGGGVLDRLAFNEWVGVRTADVARNIAAENLFALYRLPGLIGIEADHLPSERPGSGAQILLVN